MRCLLPAAFAAVAATALPAAAVTFDFTRSVNGNIYDASFVFMEGGLTVAVSSAAGGGSELSQNQAGLGVRGGAASQRAGEGEGFILSFDGPVSLVESLIFERRRGTDTIRIADQQGGVALLTTLADRGSNTVAFPLSGLSGRVFSVDVLESTGNRRNTGIRLAGLEIAAIPGPAGALSLATAFGLAAGFKRRGR